VSTVDALVRATPVPRDVLGEMHPSTNLLDDPPAVRARLAEDGFLFLPRTLDEADVLAARAEVLGRLEAVEEIEPGSDGVFTGRSKRDELYPDRGAFWRSVSNGPRLRVVSHGRQITAIMMTVFGEPVVPLDYLMLRVAVQGRATAAHYDYPFFTRLHERVCTVWTALGAVPISRGPLFVIEGSHRFADMIDAMRGFDVATDTARTAAFEESALEVARRRGTRLLTADFAAGDVVIFGMKTAHGSFDHHDRSGRVRLSCDARWQPATLPLDNRYMEPGVGGTTGAGYAELNGAKPLTEQWHVR
jgi:ectoine hydroxylase-related dioxygenase (phytanoyl-CoA dioxygenase family)